MKKIFLRNTELKLLVDDEDYEFLNLFIWKIIKKRRDYIHPYSTHFGKIIRPHRLVLKIDDPKTVIDHRDGNPLNNQKNNLRICTNSQNSRNIGKRKGNYTSKYKGINWNKNNEKWHSRINTDNGRIHLGCFDSEIAAAKAYNEAAIIYHGEFAKLNIIEE